MTKFKDIDINLLKKICETPGVSGFEYPILDLFKKILKNYTNNIIDLNRLIRAKFGNEKGRVIIITSIDEPGFLIKKLNEKNKAEFIKIGFLDDRYILDKYVLIYDKSYSEIGKIRLKDCYLKDKREIKSKLFTYKEMIIETDYENTKIRPGLPASFYSPIEHLNKPNIIIGKALCNRCCSFVTFELIRKLKVLKSTYNIEIQYTTLSETLVDPPLVLEDYQNIKFGIILDYIDTSDIPGVDEEDTSICLGKGPVISLVDYEGKFLSDYDLFKMFMETAISEKIPYQVGLGIYIKKYNIQNIFIRSNIPFITILIPVRYANTPNQMINLLDLKSLIDLLLVALSKTIKNTNSQ